MELYTVQELHDKVFEGTYKVYEVFKDFFGEENVDLQGVTPPSSFELNYREIDLADPDLTNELLLKQFNTWYSGARPEIYVHWDKVTVTNENDKSVDIQDLYAKVVLTPDGRIPYENHGFMLNRSTYTATQWHGNYLHSHISSIPKDNISTFQKPCLGKGPINGTIAELKNTSDEVEWMLFCQELSIYVTVESLEGIPYNKLENIGKHSRRPSYNTFEVPTSIFNANNAILNLDKVCGKGTYSDFIGHYLRKGHLKLNYANNSFSVGMDYFNYMMDVSNCFICFFNGKFHDDAMYRKLVSSQVLRPLQVKDNMFYDDSPRNSSFSPERSQGKKVLTFKGKDVLLDITGTVNQAAPVMVINHLLAMDMLVNILKVINYRYKNEYYEQLRAGHTKVETPATIGENVRYL